MTSGHLAVDDGDLARCVSCGLCLPHCPTFRVTGDEAASPRGRIAAMRAVQEGSQKIGPRLAEVIDACVGCRGCETACPSAVPYGRLLEGTRQTLHDHGLGPSRWRRAGLDLVRRPRLLGAGVRLAAVAQRLGLAPRRFGIPRLELRPAPLRPTGQDAWLHTGCVMDAAMRPVHRAAITALESAGIGVTLPRHNPGCCGALHVHAGLHDRAVVLATATIRAHSSGPAADAPVVVDSAGCGAAMKEYGHLVGTPEAQAFAERVVDVHELLAEAVTDRRLQIRRPLPGPVAIQDPCHLRHAQRVHGAVRTVLRAVVEEVVELDDDGICCGAGGSYSLTHPDLARRIRDEKVAAITRSGAEVVASANPGCMMHLRAAGIHVVHPVELVARAVAHHPTEEAS